MDPIEGANMDLKQQVEILKNIVHTMHKDSELFPKYARLRIVYISRTMLHEFEEWRYSLQTMGIIS
jgi:hypothetical protein